MISLPDVLAAFPGSRVVPRELRPYQQELKNRVQEAFQAGHQAVLAQSCVGSGKTDLAGSIVADLLSRQPDAAGARAETARPEDGARLPGPECIVLFIAHRRELIENAVERMQLWGISADDIGIIRADDVRSNAAAPLQVASVQTLQRRAPLPVPPKLVIIDEAHRAASETYRRLREQYPIARFLGLTASPLRTDGTGLDAFFDCLVAGPLPSALMGLGVLARPRVYAAPLVVEVSRGVMGTVDELGEVMSAPRLVGNVYNEWERLSGGRTTVAFASSVQHSRTLCDLFRSRGVASAHVDGTTPDDARAKAFEGLAAGHILCLFSYGVAVEGIDIPRAKCCIMARPTTSLVVWIQATGRVLRPWEGVTPVILDHGGNTERLGSCVADRSWSLQGATRSQAANEFHVCLHCFAYVSTTHPCAVCGVNAPSRQEREIEADESVRLQEVVLSEDEAEAWKKQVFERFVAKCAREGRDLKMPGAAFKAQFKYWPTEWQRRAEEWLKGDDTWQRQRQKRQGSSGS